MVRVLIANTFLLITSIIATHDDYYSGTDSEEDGVTYLDTLYDLKTEWPLNLDGSLRQRMALNGAIAEPGKSFVCSPISALMPLGKLALGATGTCKSQLEEAIGVDSEAELKRSFKSLLGELRSLSGVQLAVCSRIYVSKDYKLKPQFQLDAKFIFKSTVKRISLNKPDHVAKKINRWVSDKTNGMIEEIIEPNSISPHASVILVNAVYFSGKWQKPFPEAEMRDFMTATDIRKVPMMTREGKYKYAKSDSLDCQFSDNTFKNFYHNEIEDEASDEEGTLAFKVKQAIAKKRPSNSIEEFFETPKKKTKVFKKSSAVSKTGKEGVRFITSGSDDGAYASRLIKIEIYDMDKIKNVSPLEHWKFCDTRVKYYANCDTDVHEQSARDLIYNITKDLVGRPKCVKYTLETDKK